MNNDGIANLQVFGINRYAVRAFCLRVLFPKSNLPLCGLFIAGLGFGLAEEERSSATSSEKSSRNSPRGSGRICKRPSRTSWIAFTG